MKRLLKRLLAWLRGDDPLSVAEAYIVELVRENSMLRCELDETVNAEVLKRLADVRLASLDVRGNMIEAGIEGGAAQCLVEAFYQQFRDGGATNFLELSFVDKKHRDIGPLVVTLQRVQGVTPAVKARLLEEQLTAANERIDSMLDGVVRGFAP